MKYVGIFLWTIDIESTRTPILYNINVFFKFDWSGAIVRALEGINDTL